MKQLNKMRLLCGLPIDPSIEITEKKEVVTEARTVPVRKSELSPKDEKALGNSVAGIKSAMKHIEQAIRTLDKIPATDFMGHVPRYIQELEDLIQDDDGMEAYLTQCEDGARKFKRAENAKRREEDEETLAATRISEGERDDDKDYDDEDGRFIKCPKCGTMNDTDDMRGDTGCEKCGAEVFAEGAAELEESMHMYNVSNYKDYEEDDEKPINVSDGSSNGEQVWDEPRAAKNQKKESPEQLRTHDEKSKQDQSEGHDLEAEMKIPASIKRSLTTAIAEAKAEAKKMDVSNKDASYFYNDLARAFEDLKGHLDRGTRYDFKKAQVFASGLMGPMLHKIPDDVWKFLTNGGETRSLKDYMKPVKDYIEGPRNTIK